MRNQWIIRGVKTVLWLTWLYPFLRLVMIPLIAILEPYMTAGTVEKMMKGAKYFHGGSTVSALLMSWYMAYFAVSVAFYLVWHYKANKRPSGGHWIVLLLVILFNFLNVFLLRAVAQTP